MLVGRGFGVGDASFGAGDGLGLSAVVGLTAVPGSCHLLAAVLESLDGSHRCARSCMFCLGLRPSE